MKNSKNVQEILDKMAREKLQKDIEMFLKTINDSPLWNSISEVLVLEANPDKKIERIALRSFFWPSRYQEPEEWNRAPKMIIENLLPKYIEAESKAFFEKVDNLQNQFEQFEQDYQAPE